MTTEQKYNAMVTFLKAIGKVKGEFKLAPISGHLEYDVHSLWVEGWYSYGDTIHYSTDSFPSCRIMEDNCNYEDDVEFLYTQLLPLMDMGKNLF